MPGVVGHDGQSQVEHLHDQTLVLPGQGLEHLRQVDTLSTDLGPTTTGQWVVPGSEAVRDDGGEGRPLSKPSQSSSTRTRPQRR